MVSDPNSDWIRICVFALWIRIRGNTNDPQKRKEAHSFMCWMFSCSMKVLREGECRHLVRILVLLFDNSFADPESGITKKPGSGSRFNEHGSATLVTGQEPIKLVRWIHKNYESNPKFGKWKRICTTSKRKKVGKYKINPINNKNITQLILLQFKRDLLVKFHKCEKRVSNVNKYWPDTGGLVKDNTWSN